MLSETYTGALNKSICSDSYNMLRVWLNLWQVHYPQQNTLSAPKKHAFHGCLKKPKLPVMTTGSINYLRLVYWRILASHSNSTSGKRQWGMILLVGPCWFFSPFYTVQEQTMLYQWKIRPLEPLRDCSICWFIQAPSLTGPAVTPYLSPGSTSLNG